MIIPNDIIKVSDYVWFKNRTKSGEELVLAKIIDIKEISSCCFTYIEFVFNGVYHFCPLSDLVKITITKQNLLDLGFYSIGSSGRLRLPLLNLTIEYTENRDFLENIISRVEVISIDDKNELFKFYNLNDFYNFLSQKVNDCKKLTPLIELIKSSVTDSKKYKL